MTPLFSLLAAWHPPLLGDGNNVCGAIPDVNRRQGLTTKVGGAIFATMNHDGIIRTCEICGAREHEDDMAMVGPGAPVASRWVCNTAECLLEYVYAFEREVDTGMYQEALTVEQYAKSRGTSARTVRRWIDEHGLPVFHLGQILRIRRDDVEAWERKHTRVASVA